jgi:hypothetical protein
MTGRPVLYVLALVAALGLILFLTVRLHIGLSISAVDLNW